MTWNLELIIKCAKVRKLSKHLKEVQLKILYGNQKASVRKINIFILKMSTNEKCIMCKQDIEDVYQLGEKITFEDVTVHHFCVLLSGCCEQNGDDDEGIQGFLPKDIKKEAQRSKIYRCTFCKKGGANISCCDRKCRKAFHLPCAIQNDCRFEFFDQHLSFCNTHHGIKKSTMPHDHRDECVICNEPMGEYNIIQSLQTPCCRSKSWLHKFCIQKSVLIAGAYHSKCPLCNDTKTFCDWLKKRGIFIPERDAVWEDSEFYNFEQQSFVPIVCTANYCKLSQCESPMVTCDSCGSNGIHECCLKTEKFICDDCDIEPRAKKRKISNETKDEMIIKPNVEIEMDMNANYIPSYNTMDIPQKVGFSNGEFTVKKFKIVLSRLTQEEIDTLT
ncbi:PHD finger protein 7-like [Contarinia nasturtii]|uniref:PHD finger protein 7-like n=1 Tax=Contarinia nasturtii TaxID=265458 RepID=UPI0012D49D47|nr:PHD finger protein 7-like [Contarinia nasturtii]